MQDHKKFQETQDIIAYFWFLKNSGEQVAVLPVLYARAKFLRNAV